MSVSGIGQSYYQNNVEATKRAKSINSTKETNGFAGKVTEKISISPEDMTLEEYKKYFDEKMNSLYTHPSQKNMNWTIDITDAAYKRMKTDPEYEKKILDALAKGNCRFPFWLPQGRQRPPQESMQVKLAPRRAHMPPLVVYLCAPRKRGEYVTSASQFRCPRHSVPPSLSFSALVRVGCGGVLSRLSDLILDIIC